MRIIGCIVIYIVGRKIIHYLNRLIDKVMNNKKLDSSVASFFKSLANILLTMILLFLITNILGINNSFFITLLASIGVTFGMALSGTLQNFSGGVVVLLFRPYKVGDYILIQGHEGMVRDIQVFNTVIVTSDNRTIFIPNGGLSSNVIINYSEQDKRRIDWTFSIAYGNDYDKVKQIILDILIADSRIFVQPAPSVVLKELNDNSIDIWVCAWLLSKNYSPVYFSINESVYRNFAANNIDIHFQ
ncbi:mechanosensitive ion channel family protein [Candidatus Azobacteroides pseudotrichonymphae]|jgi:small conductance mechanosensitive channel|nr:mechanosensitive ion channel domain-containing protein [Candidatus Azobacteroides pseudotrichonymphae]MDR0529951.1 mechanosensitive ion channel [Bacteroidales bacterium OttesenSCG-928-I14]